MSGFLRKSFTALTVVATIVWSVGLASFVPTAQAVSSGDLIKASGPAVYYYGADGKRYVFPNEKTFKTWYSDFSSVVTITDSELAAIPIGGNVTYRPGVKLVKITTDPKVYAVDANGTLRWVTSEAVAEALYGANWASMVEDIPDAFFVNYTIGADINDASDFDPAAATAAAVDINTDKNLAGGGSTSTGGALTISLASDSPIGQSVPGGSTSPASDVVFAKINLTAGSNSVDVSKITVTRTGLSADTDLAAVQLWDGSVQLDSAQTLNSNHQAGFNVDLTIPANTTKTLTITGDLAANSGNNSAEISLGIASNDDIVSNASSVMGAPVFGNTMTATNVNVGKLTISQGSLMPATNDTVDLGDTDDFFGVRFQAGSVEDVTITWINFEDGDNSSIDSTDLEDIELYNVTTGEVIASLDRLAANGDANFDLSANPIQLTEGQSVDLSLRATVVDGAGQKVAFDIHDGVSFNVMAHGSLYGFGVNYSDGGGWTNSTGVGVATTINQGTVTVSKASTSPATGNIPVGGTDVVLAEYQYEIEGEDVRFGQTIVDFALGGGASCTDIFNTKLVDKSTGVVLAGPVDPAAGDTNADGDTCTATFTDTYELPNGTNTVQVVTNVLSSAPVGGTVQVNIDNASNAAFSNVRGLTSDKTINPAPVTDDIAANTLTLEGATVIATMGGTPLAGNVVRGIVGYTVGYIGLDASTGGEDVRLSSLTITNTGTSAPSSTPPTPLTGQYANVKLVDVATGAQVGKTKQPDTTTPSDDITFTFTGDEAVVKQNEQLNLAIVLDVLSGATAGTTHAWDVTAAAGTGVQSATSATVNVASAVTSPVQTIVANGDIRVTLDADTPVSDQLVAGTTGASVATYKIEAKDEALDIRTISIFAGDNTQSGTAATKIAQNVMSVEVYVDGVKVGSTLSSNSTGLFLLSVADGTIVVPKDGDVRLTIKVNLYDDTNLASGSNFQIGIADSNNTFTDFTDDTDTDWSAAAAADTNYGMEVIGLDSGAALTDIDDTFGGDGQMFGGNEMFMYDGVLTVTLNSSSPSGLRSPRTDEDVLIANFTATGDDITIDDIELTVNTSCTLTGAAGVATTITDESENTTYATLDATLSNGDGVSTDGSGSATAVTVATWDSVLSISKGTTKVIKVIADTSECSASADESIQVGFGPAGTLTSGVSWADDELKTAGTVVDSTLTDDLPLNGNTLSY